MTSLYRSFPGRALRIGLSLMILVGIGAGAASAASTAKSMSTNFTLINFGSTTANVTVSFIKENGTAWAADAANTSFTIPANGGQKQVRQYPPYETTMTTGRGSAIVNSDQPLGAVVQIKTLSGNMTTGAYSGLITVSSSFYVPLAARRLSTASGLGNSQIMVQNAGASSVSVDVQLLGPSGDYTKSGVVIPAGATFYYDLDDETNLPTNWYGSAVVNASGGAQIAVVSNFFTGADAMQSFNAFPAGSPGTNWLVPIFTSRLANGLSTVVTVQNLSGGQIAAAGIQLICTKDASSPAPATFTITNPAPVDNNRSYNFNPVTNTSMPNLWYGSCRIVSPGAVVAIVQMRYVSGSAAASYEALKAGTTDTKVMVPLIAKRLANGFATVVNIQNISASSEAHVTFTYIPSPDYIAGGGSASNIVVGPYTIPAAASIQQNHRLVGTGSGTGQHNLPDGWYGSLVVSSSDQPISGIAQLTYYTSPAGDWFMAHDAFTQP